MTYDNPYNPYMPQYVPTYQPARTWLQRKHMR